MSFLKKYTNKYMKSFFAAVAFLTLEAVCDLLQPAIMSRIIDIGVASRQMDYVLRMGGLMFLFTLLGAFAAVNRNIIASRVSQNFGMDLRSDLFKKIQAFTFDSLNKFEGASLITRLTNDVTQVQNFANGLMRIFVKAPLLCVGSIIMAARLNPGMALILVVVIPVISIYIFISVRTGFPYFSKVQKSMDKVNGVMREYLSGVRVVKAFNRFDHEVERFGAANEELTSLSTTAMRIMSTFMPGITLVVNLGIAVVIWIGGYRVNSGNMQVGQIIAFVNYMTQILFSLMMITFVFIMFVRARASAERLNEVFEEKTGMSSNNTGSSTENTVHTQNCGMVEFDHVSFSYSGTAGEPVLKDITFKCTPGETIGIIGPTGSGKSTLVNLIPRFYDVSSGCIRIGGRDARYSDPGVLRETIAIVPQKSILFTGTIIDNITWGNEYASADEVKEASRTAEAHDFIASFPEGYETLLGQGGVNLSGGQKQRVSIARALVRKPEILILDDCTSAVDVTTEARIRKSIKEFSEGMTCFIIAQRITSVMHADRILVMDNGEIVGIGKHEDLLKACEVYRDIYQSQIGKEEAV